MEKKQQSSLAKESTLSVVEAIRVAAVVEKAIERLQLLAIISAGTTPAEATAQAAAAASEQPQPGDGHSSVSNLLEEHLKLEERYEELLAQRNTKMSRKSALSKADSLESLSEADPSANPSGAGKDIANPELRSIANALRSCTNQLYRQLKENPNVSDNWRKVQRERAELQTLLSACIHEILGNAFTVQQNASVSSAAAERSASLHHQPSHHMSHDRSASSASDLRSPSVMSDAFNQRDVRRLDVSYEMFASKILEEKERKKWADDVVNREREALKTVKKLQDDLNREKETKEREIHERSEQLHNLKNDLRSLKSVTGLEQEKKRAENEAAAEAARRVESEKLRSMDEDLRILRTKLEEENRVHEEVDRFLKKRAAEMQDRIQEWMTRYDTEIEELEDELEKKRKERKAQLDRLKECEEKYALEVAEKQQREEEARLRAEQRKRMIRENAIRSQAARVIQNAWRRHWERKKTAQAAKKKGGKKKGKK